MATPIWPTKMRIHTFLTVLDIFNDESVNLIFRNKKRPTKHLI